MTFIVSQGSFKKTKKQKQNKNKKAKQKSVQLCCHIPIQKFFNTSIINIRSKLMSHITVKNKQTKNRTIQWLQQKHTDAHCKGTRGFGKLDIHVSPDVFSAVEPGI